MHSRVTWSLRKRKKSVKQDCDRRNLRVNTRTRKNDVYILLRICIYVYMYIYFIYIIYIHIYVYRLKRVMRAKQKRLAGGPWARYILCIYLFPSFTTGGEHRASGTVYTTIIITTTRTTTTTKTMKATLVFSFSLFLIYICIYIFVLFFLIFDIFFSLATAAATSAASTAAAATAIAKQASSQPATPIRLRVPTTRGSNHHTVFDPPAFSLPSRSPVAATTWTTFCLPRCTLFLFPPRYVSHTWLLSFSLFFQGKARVGAGYRTWCHRGDDYADAQVANQEARASR